MTHDEAIEILNDLDHKGTTQKETYAIGLAIKALSETDGDVAMQFQRVMC